ncbi:TPA: endospore germination permease [Bacillus cereus]|uniref:Spore gernimation protein n=1 Tax=Bacillus cereus TaxID=1396 RepID=A0A1D3NM20_BACCE|nr:MULTISPECIES: endospore germination permease [Bacillus]MCG3423180.1 endospore germination permease [Bacillus thuringiensis]MCP1179687.1 endospore germination permease [Bacillus sp. 1663tsa1]MCP1281933.1 endospore germination permease [Bacillus sp. S0635]MCQ6348449.1 endospore germination permease [Bacillus cereus]MCU5460806.1 endospore germination permease [Bacillus cereus]
MTKRAKREITLFQYILTISGVQVGFGLLTLPREVAEGANTDGWISVIIGCAITILVSLCIVHIMSKHPGYTLLDVLIRYLGKWLGKGMMVLWILYAVLAAVSLIFSLLYIVHIWILPRSPMFLIMILLSIPMIMLACKGVLIISRYAVFTLFFTIWMPLLLFIPLKDGHWIYLLPLLKEGWLPVLNTVKSTIIAFLGFEFAFVLYPYLSNKSSAKKGIVLANLITLFIYLQVTFVSFVYFSPDGITKFLWPTLSLITPFHFSFLERFEIIFLSFYLFIIFDSCIPYIFTASDGINQLLNKQGSSLPIWLLLFGCIFVLLFYTPSSYQINALRDFWGTASYFIVFLFPVVFLSYITFYQYWKRRNI